MKRIKVLSISLLLMAFAAGCGEEAFNLNPETSPALNTDNSLSGSFNKEGKNFRAHLAGSNTTATGEAIFQFNEDDSELYFKLIVANIKDVTAAHIHHAHNGEQTGHAVLPLYSGNPSGAVNGILAEGILTSSDITCTCPHHNGQHSLSHLKQHMIDGETYVNVHTVNSSAGEIRGWIH